MKKLLPMALVLILLLCACAGENLANLTTESSGEGYLVTRWADKTYVPYGPLSAYGARGRQIGVVDGDQNHRVYELKGYSSDQWIVTALPYDAAMLLKEIHVTDIPEDWESEYEWNR